jgi:hypothetical protein
MTCRAKSAKFGLAHDVLASATTQNTYSKRLLETKECQNQKSGALEFSSRPDYGGVTTARRWKQQPRGDCPHCQPWPRQRRVRVWSTCDKFTEP